MLAIRIVFRHTRYLASTRIITFQLHEPLLAYHSHFHEIFEGYNCQLADRGLPATD